MAFPLAVIVWLLLCFAIAAWARSKGRSSGAAFAISFLFSPLVGALVVLMMRRDTAALERERIEEGMRPCPFCAELVRQQAVKCRYCGSDISSTAVPPSRPPASSQEEQRRLKRKVWLIVLALIVLAWVAAWVVSLMKAPRFL